MHPSLKHYARCSKLLPVPLLQILFLPDKILAFNNVATAKLSFPTTRSFLFYRFMNVLLPWLTKSPFHSTILYSGILFSIALLSSFLSTSSYQQLYMAYKATICSSQTHTLDPSVLCFPTISSPYYSVSGIFIPRITTAEKFTEL